MSALLFLRSLFHDLAEQGGIGAGVVDGEVGFGGSRNGFGAYSCLIESRVGMWLESWK